MESMLKKQSYSEMISVWQGRATNEYSADHIIPDVLPDVGQILEASGFLVLRSRDTRDGAIFLNAAAEVTVLYTTEELDRVLSVAMTVPIEFPINAPGTDGDCRTTLHAELCTVEARVVNSRKLAVRVGVAVDAACWRSADSEVYCAGEDIPEGVKLLYGQTDAYLVTDVREKTFVITEEFALPTGSAPGMSLLDKRICPTIKEVKTIPGKTIFRGSVQCTLLFSSEGDSNILVGRYETEFSQVVETDTEGSDVASEAFITLTGAYFDIHESGSDTGNVTAELHFAAQVLCREIKELSYVSDIYSNRTALVPKTAGAKTVGSAVPLHMHKTVSGTAEPYFTGGSVLLADAYIASVSNKDNAVNANVVLRILTRDENGHFASSRCRASVIFEPDLDDKSRLENISVSVGDVYYGTDGNGTEIRAEITLDACVLTEYKFSYVEGVEEDTELWNRQKEKLASITLVRCDTPPELWTLAKRYHSDEEVIRTLNGEKNVGLFLVPRTR